MSTRSLTLAKDPMARMKEIHDLDNPVSTSLEPEVADERKTTQQPECVGAQRPEHLATRAPTNTAVTPPDHTSTPQPDQATTQQAANAETAAPEHVGSGELRGVSALAHKRHDAYTLSKERASAPTNRRSSRPEENKAVSSNPVLDAIRLGLLESYPDDLDEGHYRASTVRLPVALWERLDMASTLLKKTRHKFHDKQDIVSEALKFYLTKIGREQV